MPSATVLTAGNADLCRHWSHPKLIRSWEADSPTYAFKQVDSPFFSLISEIFVKPKTTACTLWKHATQSRSFYEAEIIRKKHGETCQLPSSRCKNILYVYFAQWPKVESRASVVIRSRLCNWHCGVGCGWIHLPGAWGHDTDVPGSLSLAVSDRRRQLADAFHVGITACSNIETKTSARLCGKIQLWVLLVP